MNLSQRTANRIFENHGQYTVNRKGSVCLESQPIINNRLVRFGSIMLGAANVGISSALAYGASRHNMVGVEIAMSMWAVASTAWTGMFVHDDLHAANLSLPGTVMPNFLGTTGHEASLAAIPTITE